jgi:hypothetical protein
MWRRAIGRVVRARTLYPIVSLHHRAAKPPNSKRVIVNHLTWVRWPTGFVAFEIPAAILLIKGDSGWDGQGDVSAVTAELFHAPDLNLGNSVLKEK